jgi:uncharacterized membrane protein YgdD (TMEM256/DUF423 family)
MTAAGFAAAAGAAHGGGGMLEPASRFLLVHAAAILALGGHTPAGLAAIAVIAAGSIIFAGDMAMRTWYATALFPMTAPLGGTSAIVAWLLAAIAVARPR